MKLLPGYKRTDLGFIPLSWSVKKLSEIGTCLIGLTYKPADVSPHGLLVLRSSNVSGGTLKFDDNVHVNVSVPDKLLVRDGDILICVRNGSRELIGKCARIDRPAENMTFGAFMAIFRTPFSEYVYYHFQSDLIRRQIHEHLGATINQITNKSLRSFRLPLADRDTERQAIGMALRDVDALLNALQRLIIKKRAIKQIATQRLLTGRSRIRGHNNKVSPKRIAGGLIPEGWSVERLENIGRWFSGGTPRMSDKACWSGDVPWVSPKDMKVSRIHDTIDHVTEHAIGNGTRIAPQGALLIVVRGMILAHSFPVARAERPVAFNQDIKALVVRNGVDSEFMLRWLEANERNLLARVDESTHGTKRMPMSLLFAAQVALPPPDEQTAIAAVLSDMDAEIAALEHRRDKTLAIKQGMMQELLTGRTRLV